MPTKSKGQVHDVFNGTINDLQSQAAAQAKAARGTGLRPWNVPKGSPDVLDVPGTTTPFDRSKLDQNFATFIADGQDPGTIGDVISVKVQGDYVAMAERAYRARHCTPVRLLGFMAARRAGHGNDRGVFKGGVGKYAQDALKAGQS